VLRGRKACGAALAAVLCGLSALAAAPIGAPGSARVEATAEVRLLEIRQSEVLAAGNLPLSVEADDAVTVKLRGRSRIAAQESKVAMSRIVKLEAGEEAEVELPLTEQGRERLRRCDDQELVVKVRVSAGDDPLGDGNDGRGRIAEQLVRDDPACTPEQAD
jgi:hypothetical protein